MPNALEMERSISCYQRRSHRHDIFLFFSLDIESVSDEDGMLDDYEEEDGGKGNDSDFSEDTPFQV